MWDENLDTEELLGAAAKKAAPAGARSKAIAQKQAIVAKLRADAKERAVVQRELAAEQRAFDTWMDPVTGQTYRAWSFVLTQASFTMTANTASAETVIGAYSVPTGIEILFRGVKGGMTGAWMDRQAPYLYGKLYTSALALVTGTLRIKVWDASQNDLKGQPFTGNSDELNAASAIDWNLRLFFNSLQPVRAKEGDVIQITLNAATVVSTTASTWTLKVLQLSKM